MLPRRIDCQSSEFLPNRKRPRLGSCAILASHISCPLDTESCSVIACAGALQKARNRDVERNSAFKTHTLPILTGTMQIFFCAQCLARATGRCASRQRRGRTRTRPTHRSAHPSSRSRKGAMRTARRRRVCLGRRDRRSRTGTRLTRFLGRIGRVLGQLEAAIRLVQSKARHKVPQEPWRRSSRTRPSGVALPSSR